MWPTVSIIDFTWNVTHSINYCPVPQYNATNVMHFSFNLLRIECLYIFRALLAHPQEALHKRHLVYCVGIMSVGSATTVLQSCHSQLTYARTHYTKCRLCTASWGWASNVRNMKGHSILNKLNEKFITLVSLYWYTMMHGQQNIKFVQCHTTSTTDTHSDTPWTQCDLNDLPLFSRTNHIIILIQNVSLDVYYMFRLVLEFCIDMSGFECCVLSRSGLSESRSLVQGNFTACVFVTECSQLQH
jgi:hypothetical protein